jgi:hypothetical protein
MSGGRDDTRATTGRMVTITGAVLLVLTIALIVAGTALLFGGGGYGLAVWGLPGGSGLWALGFSAAGYPITRRHPANPVGWCLMAAGVASGVNLLGLGLANGPDDLALWLVNTWVVSVGAMSTAVVLFPSGSPPSRWWWAQLGVLWVSGTLVYGMNNETRASFVGPLAWLDVLAVPVDVVFQLSLAAGFLALLARWRRSGAVERQQLKWVVYSVAVLGTTALVVEVVITNLFPAWYLAATVALYIAILAVPVAIGVAMLRYRLYDIDVVINRTLVYASLTASLGLVYVGGVVGLQYVFRVFAGGGSQLAIVASTLLIAALFNPLRRHIQSTIDRRFYRHKYDVARTLEALSARLREETDLDQLNAEVLSVVQTTMQPEHASLWLRKQGDER